jgi:hypothetical protein
MLKTSQGKPTQVCLLVHTDIVDNPLFGDFRFRREKRLGGLARAYDLLAIIAAELAPVLRAVEKEFASERLASRLIEGKFRCLASPIEAAKVGAGRIGRVELGQAAEHSLHEIVCQGSSPLFHQSGWNHLCGRQHIGVSRQWTRQPKGRGFSRNQRALMR